MEKFIIGALCGGIVGALAVSNNAKMRMLVKKGEDELKEKISGMVDEKLSVMLEKSRQEGGNAEGGAQTGAQAKEQKKSKKKSDKKQSAAGDAAAQSA
ncbi:MAG: hypothetical protein ACI4RO_04280 [Candidatus Scatosoma sp.]